MSSGLDPDQDRHSVCKGHQHFFVCCVIFHLLLSADFFQNHFFSSKNYSGTHVGPDLGPNCLQRLSAEDKLPLAMKKLKLDERNP